MSHDLTMPVRLFFQQFPWQGVAIANGHSSLPLDLHLTVTQFWQQWPWQGGGDWAETTVPTLAEWMMCLGV